MVSQICSCTSSSTNKQTFRFYATLSNAALTANDIKKPKVLEEPALIKLKKERNPDRLFHLFKANASNRLVVENSYAFEDTVSRLAGAGRFDYIEKLLEQQKGLPQGRREGFVVRIIMLYGKCGMVKHAVSTFRDMGCCRSVKSVNAVLKVLGESGDLEAFERFVSDVRSEFRVELDVVSVNIVIDSLCKMGFPDKAYVIMCEMERSGIKPDVVTYTTLISAFYKLGRAEIGNGIWNLMVMKGCFPNLATFNARVQFLVNHGRAWQANSLMGMMRYIGIMPDEVTFNLVIKGFCRARFMDMAKRVYDALHDEGYKPNARIYQTMMHYLCKEGDFSMAYTMCRRSMEKNWYPSVDSIYELLRGLQTTGKIDKARLIISLVHKKVPSYNADQLGMMESILKKS
ncbi:tetratricopeptide repeat (TPR)-like superfamily protein [Artemisia annua]|uniref:Tetratricopeptide repeat (TPR)-like superfamily protein n=1 Tax=Artemisia annua TaxID=35608 RepID=A0A2U1KID1_ARTAN|nr:tetratricopeptide repeat (TPR)-like superfamily protein [Artemisia annua]